MRTQQQADREEQQRIKNLVLNYEASNEPEPTESKFIQYARNYLLTDGVNLGFEKRIPANQRVEKPTPGRAFRSRKLQLSDVNW